MMIVKFHKYTTQFKSGTKLVHYYTVCSWYKGITDKLINLKKGQEKNQDSTIHFFFFF